MRKFAFCATAICLVFLSAAAQKVEAAYWDVNATTKPAPYVAPPYTCTVNYYVAPSGSDTSQGTSQAPWKTMSHAIAALASAGLSGKAPQGGVCVNAAPGTYTESLYIGSYLTGSSDTPAGYLVFRSLAPHEAILQEPYANIATYKSNVIIQNSRYVIFDGFEVVGYPNVYQAGAAGFQSLSSHHIKFLNNLVHDIGGTGIATIYSDYVTTQGNIVYGTACCSSYGASAIAYYEPVAVDTKAGFHNVISSNISFNNFEGADGRSPHSEGHGIMLDSFRMGPSGSYPAATLIENNLVYGNGGVGINIYYSNNVTIRNNTAFNNNRDPLITFAAGEISVWNSSYITGVNNIAVANVTMKPALLSIWDQTWDHTNIGNVWGNNLTFDGTPGDPSVGQFAKWGYGTAITAANGNILGANPLLVNPAHNVFTLQPASPAIGKGTAAYGVPACDLAGNVRSTTAVDIGAFAFNIMPPS
jgi:serralysin